MVQNIDVHNVVGAATGTVVQAGTIGRLVVHRLAPGPPVPRQLPGRVRDFSGREKERVALDEALSRLDDAGAAVILVLHGTAGVGKTTLAVWWAHEVHDRFPDGVLFTDLRGFGPSPPSAPELVLAGFLAALGVPEEDIPADLDAQSALYRSLLASRKVLVLLDNAATAEQLRPLLPAAPGCLVVVTSRATLHGLEVRHGAHRFPVDLLAAGEAYDLVEGVIGEARADAERGAVVELVEICARLPLALRIAATRVRSNRFLDVADVVRDIRHDLAALSGPDDERSAITTVFDWSYARLSAAQARLFRLLGLHPAAEFGPYAAAALAALAPDATVRLLAQLADHHLVEQVGRQRYRVHDLLHAYAAERAQRDEPGGRAALARLVTWYARAADAADERVFPGTARLAVDPGPAVAPMPVANREQALTWLDAEHLALIAARRLAGEFGLVEAVVLLAGAARHLTLGRRTSWPDRLAAETDGLVAARSAGYREAEGFLLVRRGNTRRMLGDYDGANADFRSVLALADGPVRRYEALCGLGSDGRDRGRPADAVAYYEAALPVVRQTGDVLAEAIVVCNLGQINASLGRFDVAMAYSRQELALRRIADDALGVAYAQHNVAVAHQGLGEHRAVVELCQEALATYDVHRGAEEERANVLETLAISLARTGRRAEAVRCLRAAVVVLAGLDSPRAERVRSWADGLTG